MAVVTVTALGPAAMAQSSDSKIEALYQRLELLEDTVTRQETEIIRQEEEIEALQQQLEALETKASGTLLPEITRVETPPVQTEAQTKEQLDAQNRANEGEGLETETKSDNEEPQLPDGRFPDDAIVTTGDFPGSITIPGSDTSIRISGFVKVNTIYDFDSLGFEELVTPPTIPLNGSAEDGTNQLRFHTRNTRFNVDVRRDTELGPFRAFVEADFFGGGDELRSNYELRVRHAIARLGDFYIGQWWSSFDDIPARPELNDDGGPLGTPGLRQPGIRWEREYDPGWRVGLALESPAGDLSGSEDQLASDSFPDLIGYIRLNRPWGRLRVAGLLRRLESTTDEAYVGGVNVSGRIPLRFLGERDNLAFAIQTGSGFTRYYGTFTTAGLDGFIDSNGSIDPVDVLGGYAAYQHWWSDRVRSSLVLSFLDLDLPNSADADSFDHGRFAELNLFWTPVNDVTFGAGLVYADRENFNGAQGSGLRFHGSARYDF